MSGLILFVLKLCWAAEFDPYYGILEETDAESLRAPANEINFNQTYFEALESYQVNAKNITIANEKWLGRVVHTYTNNWPHMCTGCCIDRGIFITSARCINSLKIRYTSIIYQGKRLHARAFVFPSQPTQQMYDDIGFIVLDVDLKNETYYPIQVTDVKRTDDTFQWVKKLVGKFKVVGFSNVKGLHKIKLPEKEFQLTELPVVIGMDICPSILSFRNIIKGFYVPCYHSCTVQEFQSNATACTNYHGVDGAGVVEINQKKLFGLATWGAYSPKCELPVGIAFANSASFLKDFACAKIVRDAKTPPPYQPLCGL